MQVVFWNASDTGKEFVYGTGPIDYLACVAAPIPVGPVLCLAEGEGRKAVWLAARGDAVTAVDHSEVGLAKAQALAGLEFEILREVREGSKHTGVAAVVAVLAQRP